MASMKMLAVAGTAVFLTLGAANAADMPVMMQRPVVHEFSGWYLRGDIGFSNQQVKRLDNALYATTTSLQQVGLAFDSAPLFGLGVGYQYNNWLRFDVTGEYRGKANFHGLDIVNGNGTDEYRASKSEWLTLANVYFDLGTWWSITPFVGAGVGFSYNRISSFLDVCTTCPGGGVAYAADAGKWNFAWAVHGGLAYRVTPAFTVELAYRYVDLGDAASGDIVTFNGINNVFNPMEFKGLTSHDVKLGVRWMIMPEPHYAPPLITKG